jgi:ABC-type Fe3+-hydroxamate transport system substrate-binding protein
MQKFAISRIYGTIIIVLAVLIASSNGTSIGIAFAQTPSSMNNSNSSTATVPTAPTNATNTMATNATEETAVANQSLLLQSSSSNSSSSTTSNQTRVIKHDMGETTITGTPERVVVMGDATL